MSGTFTATALGDYLCIGIEGVRLLIGLTFKPMDPNALTEEDINIIFNTNPNLTGNADEFISWYYLDYSVDKNEAANKRYTIVRDRNWKRVTGYELY
jgi:hypothetical protein